MKSRLNFALKIFLSLLINFGCWLGAVAAVIYAGFEVDPAGFWIIAGFMVLDFALLFVVYRVKPLEEYSAQPIIYWIIAGLGLFVPMALFWR